MRVLRSRIKRGNRKPDRFFLIIKSIDRYMYMSIINIEMMLWMRYKMDPFTMLGNISLNDLLFYTQTLTNRLEEEKKNQT